MQTLISYSSDSRAYVAWLAEGRPSSRPSDVPFRLPQETQKGDRYLLYVGGQDQTFVGWGKIQSGWRIGTRGWKGEEVVQLTENTLRQPVTGLDVLVATGFKPPRSGKVVDDGVASAVWRAARGKPLSQTDRAVEGIMTESRSRSRNAGLRLAAIQRAKGVCEGCGVNFGQKHGGLGSRCLVVHHKKQLKDTDQPVETKLSDLVVVCANCHMMIHVNRDKALTMAQLKKRIGRN